MTHRSIVHLSLAALSLIGPAVSASQGTENPSDLLKPKIRVGLSALHGIEANFSNLGTSGFLNDPGPATGGAEDRNYDDGFNRADISGNAGNLTSNWGYVDNAQYDGSSITLSSAGSNSSGSVSEDSDLIPGLEIAVDYPLGRFESVDCIDEWGLSLALQWHRIDIENKASLRGDSILIEDSFSTNGGMPPAAPYSGSFTGPGFLLDSTPDRTVTTLAGGGFIDGSRKLEADLFSLQFGPYARVELSERFTFNFSAGAILAYIHSEYEIESNSSLSGGATGSSRAEDDAGDFLAGAYARAGLEYAINEQSHFHLDLGWRQTEDFDQTAGGSQAELDFGSALSVAFAVSFDF